MSERLRTMLAFAGLVIIFLSLFLIVRLDRRLHEKKMNQFYQEQEAVREGHAAEVTIP